MMSRFALRLLYAYNFYSKYPLNFPHYFISFFLSIYVSFFYLDFSYLLFDLNALEFHPSPESNNSRFHITYRYPILYVFIFLLSILQRIVAAFGGGCFRPFIFVDDAIPC